MNEGRQTDPAAVASAREALHTRIEHDLRNHPPEGETGSRLDWATDQFIALGHWLIDNVPAGREQSVALTKLEELSMWTKAGIARNQGATSALQSGQQASM